MCYNNIKLLYKANQWKNDLCLIKLFFYLSQKLSSETNSNFKK